MDSRTKIRNVTETKMTGYGVMHMTEVLRAKHPPAPHAMNLEQATSKISRPVIKKAGLC